MQYRSVPQNGDQLSVLGFGCMRLPGKRQHIAEGESAGLIHAAIEAGVNYFDTAPPYHRGESEGFLGRALAQEGYRDRVKVATKLPHWATPEKRAMHAALDKQLRELQTDRIDYYLIHNLSGTTWARAKQHGVMEFLDEAQAAGKIINPGFSFHGAAEDFNDIVDDYAWVFCQIQYNYLDTRNQAGTAGLRYAHAKDLAVMVMEPLRGGNLARKPGKAVQACWDAVNRERPPAEWGLRWIWDQPEVTVVLSGMNSLTQIAENCATAATALPHHLSEAEKGAITEGAEAFRRLMRVGCTGCQYCLPCPAGVNIPACFEYYNGRHLFDDKGAKLMYLFNLGGITGGGAGMASQCTACGRCVKKCPQDLEIPALLKEVKGEMEGFYTKPSIWLIKRFMGVRE